MIITIDTGKNNIGSFIKSVYKIGYKTKVSLLKEDVEEAKAIILPGVGAFGEIMSILSKNNLIDPFGIMSLAMVKGSSNAKLPLKNTVIFSRTTGSRLPPIIVKPTVSIFVVWGPTVVWMVLKGEDFTEVIPLLFVM